MGLNLLVMALVMAHQPAAMADRAGNRMVALAPLRRAAGDAAAYVPYCTADRRWCARLEAQATGTRLLLSAGLPGDRRAAARPFDLGAAGDEDRGTAIWPHVVIEADGSAIFGVERTRGTAYSGGGATTSRLVLLRAAPGAAAPARVLDIPFAASKDIRACFSRTDQRDRRGACSDQYEYAATLSIDPATRTGRPRLLMAVSARTFPGRLTIASDATTAPPLRRADLRWAIDPACTYRRSFAWDAGRAVYAPNRALPACADFLDF